jgi:hypothetical protein
MVGRRAPEVKPRASGVPAGLKGLQNETLSPR